MKRYRLLLIVAVALPLIVAAGKWVGRKCDDMLINHVEAARNAIGVQP